VGTIERFKTAFEHRSHWGAAYPDVWPSAYGGSIMAVADGVLGLVVCLVNAVEGFSTLLAVL